MDNDSMTMINPEDEIKKIENLAAEMKINEQKQIDEDEQKQKAAADSQSNQGKKEDNMECSEEDAENAVRGTMIGKMADLFRAVSEPTLPFAIGMQKAITLAAIGTSGKNVCIADEKDIPGCKNTNGTRQKKIIGAGLARLTTSSNLLLNAYTLLVAPAGSGKDIGNLLPTSAQQIDCLLGSDGSSEGWMDELLTKPNGLLQISELSKYLDPKSYYAKCAESMTTLYSQGYFNIALSKRTRQSDKAPSRMLDYCAPNIAASIQPGMLRKKGSTELIESGLLSRFLMFDARETTPYWSVTTPVPKEQLLDKLNQCVRHYMELKGRVKLPEYYDLDFMKTFPESECRNNSILSRMVHEYQARLAVWLAMREDGTYEKDEFGTIAINADTLHRTRTVCRWLYVSAKELLLLINDASSDERREIQVAEQILNWMKQKTSMGIKMFTTTDITRTFRNSMSKNIKDKALELLEESGDIIKVSSADTKSGNGGRPSTFYMVK